MDPVRGEKLPGALAWARAGCICLVGGFFGVRVWLPRTLSYIFSPGTIRDDLMASPFAEKPRGGFFYLPISLGTLVDNVVRK